MTVILLIEDDEISRTYLTEALAGPDTTVIACEDFANAIAFCNGTTFDLIVSDIQLGDGSLFEMFSNLPADIPVIATSADLNPGTRSRLMLIGIDNHLAKPASVEEIRNAAIRALTTASHTDRTPLWNENHALKALGGNSEALKRLKDLFRSELPAMAEQIKHASAAGDTARVQGLLHKLKASCGFLGATRLLQCCHALDSDPSKQHYESFDQALKDTLVTL
jgi:CheY-like chemotaxis protein/HPt (histidine-containing phosphotransfer) domain-containing protein